MRKHLFFGLCLAALGAGPAMAQAGGPQTIVVTVQDNVDLHIVISRGPGNSEDVDVSAKDVRRNPHAREEALQQLFAKLQQEGYTLKSTFGGGFNYLIRSTLIFTRG